MSGKPGAASGSIWSNRKTRSVLVQVLVFLGTVSFFAYIVHNTLYNLGQRGITTGFGFLSSPSGFGIIQSLIDYDESSRFGRVFVVGLLNTVLVASLGIVLATLMGGLIGIARLSRNWLIAKMAEAYVETIRNIPLLLQIFFWYFGVLRTLPPPRQSLSLGEHAYLNIRGLYLPSPVFKEGFGLVLAAFVVALAASWLLFRWARVRQERTGRTFPVFTVSSMAVIGLPLLVFFAAGSPLSWDIPELKGFNFRGGLMVIPELAALLAALTIYTAAFIAEVVRAGIQAVSHGQTEAASSLGLRPGLTLRLVVLPQAMRVIIPPLTNQYLNLTKNSSLATAIGYPDLVSVFAGTALNQTGQAVETIALTMGVYLFLSLTISAYMNWYNHRKRLIEG